MLRAFKNGEIYIEGKFQKIDLLICGGNVLNIGPLDTEILRATRLASEIVDCKDCYILPGLIDSQSHLAGGSGENGFLSQPPRILIEECVLGGITTVIGAIGVDTITKTMTNLLASVKAFREAGISAYAYTGGYEIPPQSLFSDARKDILFIEEIIGIGEVAIADRRVPEPESFMLAKVIVDAYNMGLLTYKAGVTRIHVGEGQRRLASVRETAEINEVQYESLYFTHIERSQGLVKEGIAFAKKGSYVDFDIHERDLEVWYQYYLNENGPKDRLSFSTDAGVSAPQELWQEIQKCVLKKSIPLEQILPHVTEVPAKALKLRNKGFIRVGADADLLVVTKKDLAIRDYVANGKFFLRNSNFCREDQPFSMRRRVDWYGILR